MNRFALLMLVVAMAGCSKKPEADYSGKAEAPEQKVEPGREAEARITPEAAKAADIEVLQAASADIRETVTLYGTIRSNAEREQAVRARYPGIVRNVAKRPGDKVARGEVLLTIESNDSLEPYAIRSPIAGSVLDRRVNPGESVDGSATLLTVADLSNVWGEFAVFARDLSRVRAGMPVAIRAGETEVVGTTKLVYVAPAGHADSQSVVARAELSNPDGRWVSGQFVTGDVVVSDVKAAVAVVPSALQALKDGTAVFVQTDKGFEPRAVEVGHRDRGAVEILKGLAVGEKYAARNSYMIKADLLKGEAEEE